ncbi:MAG: pyridoxal phosphate-dependent aminotransferase [Synergistaceae bacterium]|jgi:aspartate aminotransferase|nr:pyridoxal phosphate-dependent aminotransferase [Synergistaceae bacterium]
MQFSERIRAMQSSPIRRLLPFSDEAKKAGKKVYHLNIGQPDIKTPDEYFQAVRNFRVDTIEYATSQGSNDLRDAISDYYKSWDIPYERDDMYITNGGSEALWFIVMTICDVGDELLVPEPFYANYNAFAQASLAKLVPIPTKAEEGFHLPPADVIEKLITPRTRAIWISNPGNPTGAVYTAAELEMLAGIARKHDIYLISDEVYREFTYDGQKFTSLGHMKDVLDRLIMVDSVSKRFSACGARIGCLIIKNREFLAQTLKLCQGRLCVSTLEQVGATGLYRTAKSYLEEVNREYKSRRDTLYRALQEMKGVVCEEPKGAFYVMVKMPVDDAEKFIVWMLQNYDLNGETMMGAPGNGFYATPGQGKSEMRLAYVLKNEDLVRATNILKGALEAYPGRLEAIRA